MAYAEQENREMKWNNIRRVVQQGWQKGQQKKRWEDELPVQIASELQET